MRALRRVLEPRLRSWWSAPHQGGTAPPLWAKALWLGAGVGEAAYRVGATLRNRAFDAGLLRAGRAAQPVVSVGNLTVGGTGKTPVAAWVAGRLVALGVRPAVLLRGYGSDEVLLHRRWNPAVPVLSDPDRRRSARLAAGLGVDVLVLDDGFQHRRLARDLDVVLISAEQELPGRHLPRGPFREGLASLERADLVVVTRRVASDSDVADRLRTIERLTDRRPAVLRLAAGGWLDLAGGPAPAPTGAVLAVTAVAEPLSFQTLVSQETGHPVALLAFPDHHAFAADDAREIARVARGRPVVVTEKDAVKLVALKELLPGPLWVLTLVVRPEAGAEELERALERVARQARALAGSGGEAGVQQGPAVRAAAWGERA